MLKCLIAVAAILAGSAALAQTAPANPLRPAPSVAPAAVPPAQASPQPTGKAADPAADTKASSRARTVKTGSGAARRTECSKRYQAAKASNTLGGTKWGQFYSKCNTELKAQGV